MYISQCIIAKNEEDNIEHCLSHLKSVVDEQIVIDTGSTDRTVEIAESIGAKVFHFDWVDDFSAARNFALDKAKGDWIIFLDCDEYFSENSVASIKDSIKKLGENKQVDGITCELINIDLNNNIIATAKNISPRLFKRKDYLKYNKRVHEILCNTRISNSNLVLADASDLLKIYHTGYAAEEINKKNKNERNINLLKKELEKNPQDAKLNLYLSKQLSIEKKYEEALDYCLKSLQYIDKTTIFDYYCIIYNTIMMNMIKLSKSYNDLKSIFVEAVKYFSDYPDFYMHMGTISFRDNRIKESIDYFEKCIYYCENFNKDIECFALGKIEKIFNDLLKLYLMDNDKTKAVKIAVSMLNADKYNFEVLTILISIFSTQEKEESIALFLNKIYDYNLLKDKIYLLKASSIIKNEKLTDYYKRLLNDEELKVVKDSQLLI
ncbi:glycosyltransferase family 2 protein [Sedimentibacter sp. B4]|uniref:glycosyltransferase family 2 protein n=1 Tax=Sedimentibacter sp. B4 TaxID=304766 RepID=UPI0002FE1BE2|nr:glycosyltransferase family 2 protein [Sedimentibacter sp. B4]